MTRAIEGTDLCHRVRQAVGILLAAGDDPLQGRLDHFRVDPLPLGLTALRGRPDLSPWPVIHDS